MHKNLLAGALGVNGVILVAVGIFILASARSQLVAFGLGPDEISEVVPTYCGLGLADASSSLFSFLAMILVYRESRSGRTLALVVAAYQLIVGVGLFVLASFPPALFFIAMRGIVIGVLGWFLPRRSTDAR